LKRIINYPIRGIGKTSVEKAVILANEHKVSMWVVLTRAGEFGFKGGTLEAISNFVTMMRYFSKYVEYEECLRCSSAGRQAYEPDKELFNDKRRLKALHDTRIYRSC
jgi:DNA helicase-2/ATP-dependent DNA helicase PcrA